MTIHPPTLEELQIVAQWREDCREALRTPFMVSGRHQEAYYALIQDMNRYRMWSFHDDVNPDSGYRFKAFGGLQDIQWENGSAEISLIVNPRRRKTGFGARAVEIILREAFDNMRLMQVWGEVYHCASEAVKFWMSLAKAPMKISKDFYFESVTLPKRKYWNGTLWDSTYFTFISTQVPRIERPYYED